MSADSRKGTGALPKPRRDLLVAKPYAYSGRRDARVIIVQPEFTSLCPMTGLPDFGTITIEYLPDRCIVELKSLKMYLLQYRQMGVFYEHVVNLILDDLVSSLAPKWMEVKGEFRPRGGMTTTVIATYGKKKGGLKGKL